MPAVTRYHHAMRLALALVLATTGCLQPHSDPPPGPDPYGGWTGPQGDPLVGCASDTDCGTQVCARDRECYPAASVRLAHTAWTVHGAAASTTSCANRPHLFIAFRGPNGASFGFAPVPCKNGEFTVDKLPTIYTEVQLGTDGTSSGPTAAIDRTTGEATIDLP